MAVNGTADSNVLMLSPGIYDVALNPGRNGRNFPIDSSKYQVLSFKLWSDATEDPQIYWLPQSLAMTRPGLVLADGWRRERSPGRN